MSGWRKRQIADKVEAHYSNTDNPVDFPPIVHDRERGAYFVSRFYNVTVQEAKHLYADEIDAYMSLASKGMFDE